MWVFRLDLSVNADQQISQENAFSPACFRLWIFRDDLSEIAVPQTSEENAFSPVRDVTCPFK